MTLREFIEQERRECHIFDIEEFGEKLKSLKWEDGEEIEPKEFENYLDYNVESANIYDCMDSHDKRIIEEIFKIVSNYNLAENTGEE